MNKIGSIMSVDKYDGRNQTITYTLHGQTSMISLAIIIKYDLYRLFGMKLDRLRLSVSFNAGDKDIHINLYAYNKPSYVSRSVLLRKTNGEVYDWSFNFSRCQAPAMNFYSEKYATLFAMKHLAANAIDIGDVYIVNKYLNVNVMETIDIEMKEETPQIIEYLINTQYELFDKKGLTEIVNTMKG